MRTGHLPTAPPMTGFAHEAFFYRGEPGFLDGTVGFAREGLANGDRVLVAVNTDRLGLLRSVLGEAPDLSYVDLAVVGRNPARIMPIWRDFLDAADRGGQSVRGIGEPIWMGRRPAEIDECRIHEALLNVAFAPASGRAPAFRMLCPYDLGALDRRVIEDARRTHPLVWERGVPRVCTAYLEAGTGTAALSGMLAEPVPGQVADRLVFGRDGLGQARSLVLRHCQDFGLDPERADDFALAVHEIATNSLLHGGGTGVLRVWLEPFGIVCEIADRGRLSDPMAGRVMPGPGQEGGRGLWLANQLCDLVQVRSHEGRTAVRLRMSR